MHLFVNNKREEKQQEKKHGYTDGYGYGYNKEMERDLARLQSRRSLVGWDGMGTLYLDSGMK